MYNVFASVVEIILHLHMRNLLLMVYCMCTLQQSTKLIGNKCLTEMNIQYQGQSQP